MRSASRMPDAAQRPITHCCHAVTFRISRNCGSLMIDSRVSPEMALLMTWKVDTIDDGGTSTETCTRPSGAPVVPMCDPNRPQAVREGILTAGPEGRC